MYLRVMDRRFLLALFQQMEHDGYKPVNRITGVDMWPICRELRNRLDGECDYRVYLNRKKRDK